MMDYDEGVTCNNFMQLIRWIKKLRWHWNLKGAIGMVFQC